MSLEQHIQEAVEVALNNALAAELARFNKNLSSVAKDIKNINEDLELMTIKQVAKKMQSSVGIVYEYIEKGELRAFKLGHLKVAMEDYNDFINKKRKGE